MQIGPYKLKSPWILAPMAGVSEMPFRNIAIEYGAGAAPTELVSAKGLFYGQDKTAQYLTRGPNDHPFWVQLFGADPESMAIGAEKAVELGAEIIDINMGCPVKKVTKTGAGSALMNDPQKAASLVRAIIDRTSVPVTAKIRSGWDSTKLNAVEVALILEDAGCSAVAVHGRTKVQGYSGEANWEIIESVAEALDIPVIGNGDLFNAASAKKKLQETSVEAVMIGRGALGNPWIFRDLISEEEIPPTPNERYLMIERHLRAQIEFLQSEYRGIRRFRQHLMWYVTGLRGVAAFRRAALTLNSVDEILDLTREFLLSDQNS